MAQYGGKGHSWKIGRFSALWLPVKRDSKIKHSLSGDSFGTNKFHNPPARQNTVPGASCADGI